MRALIALTLAALLWIAPAAQAQNLHDTFRQRPILVSVDHSGDDSVGKQFAYAVREELRASKGFRFASGGGLSYLTITIVTLPGDSSSNWSAAAVTFTMLNLVPHKQGDPQTWLPIYLGTQVMMIGANRVANQARAAVAALDESYEEYLRAERESKAKAK